MLTRVRKLTVLWCCAAAFGQQYGIPVGSKMPEFTLLDQDGKARELRSLSGANGAVLFFYRSVDWCPYCKTQLAEVERNRDEFSKLGLGVAAISYDSVAVIHEFAERRQLNVPLLSDPESKLIRELRILDQTVPKNSPYFGSSYPCSFVLNAAGTVMAKYFESDLRKRSTPADILAGHFGTVSRDRMSEASAGKVKATGTASASIVRAGQRVALTLDIEMAPDTHVYAAGAKGYFALDWKIKESTAVSGFRVLYPAAEKLYLDAIDEMAPVYRRHVRLKGVVVVSDRESVAPRADASGVFRVDGLVRFQACDEHTCYLPRELPLSWRFQFGGFDQRRTQASNVRSNERG